MSHSSNDKQGLINLLSHHTGLIVRYTCVQPNDQKIDLVVDELIHHLRMFRQSSQEIVIDPTNVEDDEL